MPRYSVCRTLSSLSLVVLLGASPAAAQSAFNPAMSPRPVVERLLSWVSEAWSGLEIVAVRVLVGEKSEGEGTAVTPPDGSTTSGTSGSNGDPSDPDNGAWIDPNG